MVKKLYNKLQLSSLVGFFVPVYGLIKCVQQKKKTRHMPRFLGLSTVLGFIMMFLCPALYLSKIFALPLILALYILFGFSMWAYSYHPVCL